MPIDVTAEIRRFHAETLLFLAYTVTPIQLSRTGASLAHMAQRLPSHQIDLPKLLEGGVNAVFLSAGSDSVITGRTSGRIWATERPTENSLRPVFTGPAEIKRMLWSIDALHRMIAENDDLIELALSAADVERIVAQGKIAGLLHLTRGAIDDDLNALRSYHRLGVRAMQIAYDDGNPAWVDSCHSVPVANGLSTFGHEVIAEMNQLGMLIDLAHASDEAHAAVIEASTQPVISSHSGARALCNVWRNLTDETMAQLAAKGGLMGAFFGSGYLDPNFWQQDEAADFRARIVTRHLQLAAQHADDPWALAMALRTPDPALAAPTRAPAKRISPLEVLLDHIDHCIGVVGEDHYCLGSDFGGIDDEGVVGLDEPSKMANLTAALLARGYSRETMVKLMGSNLLRLLRQVVGA